MILLSAPHPVLTVTSLAKRGTVYRVMEVEKPFQVQHRYAPIFSGVARDGTLWIVHGESPHIYVRAVNPQLGIATTSVRLTLNPSGWWDSGGKIGSAPSPTPAPSPVRWSGVHVLTPGVDTPSGYSAALAIPHEDGTTSKLFLVQGMEGKGHVFAATKPLKGQERGTFEKFAEHPSVKLRMLKPNAPYYFQVTMPGTTSKLATAYIAVRVVGRRGEPLAFALDPLRMNPRTEIPTIMGDGGGYKTVTVGRGQESFLRYQRIGSPKAIPPQ